ncbi:lipase member K-like [Tribolium madens]|uniref:lipase member K-like n=1 Tax=Tribolium madens TaxID=41895 RepID=UPI001CF748A9|nr:lipase member K-like [Tribolium madens]XP_044268491.1 lipase member K-like [Tribolium madens]XP_044268492.1 lipase member K-like [Tribolium madens]
MFQNLILIIFSVLYLFTSESNSEKNNVCRTMNDYIHMENNTNCWYNPDVGSSVSDIITRRGYPLESYHFQTEDGYINAIYRIPHNNINQNEPKQPIVLHPGLGGSPNSFLCVGNRSLVFFLVNNGYDVWLPHRRGSAFGKGHIKYNRTDSKFWDFSFHECGYYDIKAEIDFIKTKNSQKVILLGYSMGTTETYVYAILRKEHAKKHVAGIISLGATAYLEHPNSILMHLALASPYLEGSLKFRNRNSMFDSWEIQNVEQKITYENLVATWNLIMGLFGEDPHQLDPVDLPVYLASKLASTSIKSVIHFVQNIISGGNFQYYDYGIFKNLQVYNSPTPPLYNVSEIDIPVYIFYGEADNINPKEDVFKFYNDLKVKKKGIIHISEDKKVKYNHADFVLAKDTEKLFYAVLLRTLRENLNG